MCLLADWQLKLEQIPLLIATTMTLQPQVISRHPDSSV